MPHLLRYQSLAVAYYSCGLDALDLRYPRLLQQGSSPIAYHSKLYIIYTIIFTLTFTFCCINQKYSNRSQVQSLRFQVEDSYFLRS